MKGYFFFSGLLFFLITTSLHSCEHSNQSDESLVENEIQAAKIAALLKEYLEATPQSDVSLPVAAFESVALTYANVAPIIQENCLFCHKPGGNAPFSLKGYQNVKKRAGVIREVLSKKIMPPWMADYDYVDFFNAPQITNQERAMLISWIDRGCPNLTTEGIPQTVKEPQVSIQPDLVLSRTEQHIVTSNGDSYQCFVYDPQLEEDQYLSGIEFVSDNPEVIHHLMLYLDTTQVIGGERDCWDCKNDGIVNRLLPIQSWSKGMRPFILNRRLAYRIPAGARFILQTHYGDENNKGRAESSTLKLYFTDTPEETVDFAIINKFDIHYRAHEVTTETISYYAEDSISLIGIVPHMHFLTKKIESFAITPQQEVIPLLKISHWDYLWQGQYIYRKSVLIPKGSTIYCNIVVDNTANNPTQPNDPVRDVYYKTNSNDEMLVLVLLKKAYAPTDKLMEVAEFLN